MKKAVMLPYTFVLMNWAAVESLYQFVRCRKDAHKKLWARKASHNGCGHAE